MHNMFETMANNAYLLIMNIRRDYGWDEAKRRSNLAKHKVDFNTMDGFEWETAVIELDDSGDEERWNAIGFIGLVLHFVVYAERGDILRVISLRKADRKEVRKYAQA